MVGESMFNGLFGKVAHGMCRLSMNGGIAIKVGDNKYRSYNVKTGRLTNCTNFAFDIGEDFFFVIPANKVEKGDIILVNGKPRCVIDVEKGTKTIKVINYEDSTVETILPERHIFMGNTFFYGKIVSMFGSNLTGDKGGMKNMMKFMMISQMMKGSSGSDNNMMGNVLPLMMMGGDMGNMFDGLLDFDLADSNDTDDEDNEEEVTE